jgi:hypothetical protein
MKILGVLFLLLLLVAGVGYYRSWFSMSAGDGNAGSRKTEINLTVDRDKIDADADAVTGKVKELTGKTKEKASQLVQPANDASRSER